MKLSASCKSTQVHVLLPVVRTTVRRTLESVTGLHARSGKLDDVVTERPRPVQPPSHGELTLTPRKSDTGSGEAYFTARRSCKPRSKEYDQPVAA